MDDALPLSEDRWLALLHDPKTRLRIDLASLPFRFPRDARWDTGARRLSQHLFYFVADGSCTAFLDGKRHALPAGSLCWICPGTSFRFLSGRGRPPVIWRFRLEAVREEIAFRPAWPFRVVGKGWAAFEGMKRIVLEGNRPDRFAPWRTRSHIALLSIRVFESGERRKEEGPALGEAARERLAALVAEDPAARLAPAAIAGRLGVSADYFARLFRRRYGISPKSWLLKQRLHQAAAMLQESEARIGEVAERFGYADAYLFSRQFRKEFGISPRGWRTAGRKATTPSTPVSPSGRGAGSRPGRRSPRRGPRRPPR